MDRRGPEKVSLVHTTRTNKLGEDMDRFAISATLEARPGKEGEVEKFLKSAQALAMEEAGLQAHLNGAIAKALFAKAEELFAKPPQIRQLEILAAKPL